jgi:Protein of unknown function (DUF2842)
MPRRRSNGETQMSPALRRAIGCATILIYLPLYVFLAVSAGAWLSGAHWFAQLAFYAVAGIAWPLPLRPLFVWMGRGARNSTT